MSNTEKATPTPQEQVEELVKEVRRKVSFNPADFVDDPRAFRDYPVKYTYGVWQGAWNTTPPEWWVEGVIPKGGVGFMSGKPKEGKSLLAMDLCLHMAQAQVEPTEFLGKFKCSPANTLYISREDGEQLLATRIKEVCESYGWEPGPHLNSCVWMIRGRFNLMDEKDQEWLKAVVSEHNIDFLVLDVFNRMIPGLDENSSRDMGLAVDVIEKFNRNHNLTILLLDHTRKPASGQSPVQLATRGS